MYMTKARIHQIAKICHEANKAYCETINDYSLAGWDFAPKWQKESIINGVEFHLNGDHGPEASHESWLREKSEQGWKYGTVKDVEAKTHPCYVPYNELPPEQQMKDLIFLNIVRAFKDASGKGRA